MILHFVLQVAIIILSETIFRNFFLPNHISTKPFKFLKFNHFFKCSAGQAFACYIHLKCDKSDAVIAIKNKQNNNNKMKQLYEIRAVVILILGFLFFRNTANFPQFHSKFSSISVESENRSIMKIEFQI